MSAGLDAGDIAYECWFDLEQKATGLTVSARCAKLGIELIGELVKQAVRDPGGIPRTPQRRGKRHLYRRRDVPNDGKVDWTQSAVQINRFVRASSYRPFLSLWGEPETRLGDRTILLVSTSITNERIASDSPGNAVMLSDGTIGVVTGDGILRLDRVCCDGSVVNASEVLSQGQRLI